MRTCSIIKTDRKGYLGGVCLLFPAIVWTLFLFGRYFLLYEAWWNVESNSFLKDKKSEMDMFPSFVWWQSGGFATWLGSSDAPTLDRPRRAAETKRTVAITYLPSGHCNCKMREQSSGLDSPFCCPFPSPNYLSFLPFMWATYYSYMVLQLRSARVHICCLQLKTLTNKMHRSH